ncbi:MAG: hypothetical protein MR828_00430 [Clostridiales bacterium]|nr:hypothetical protein [Clostridiales bacterium]
MNDYSFGNFLYEQRRRTGDSQNDLAAGFYVLCNGNGTPSGAYLAPVLPWLTTSPVLLGREPYPDFEKLRAR